MTPLTKPLRRHLPDRGLVVTITPDGLELRRHRGRKPLRFTWEQIANNCTEDTPVLRKIEHDQGAAIIKRLTAKPKRKAATA